MNQTPNCTHAFVSDNPTLIFAQLYEFEKQHKVISKTFCFQSTPQQARQQQYQQVNIGGKVIEIAQPVGMTLVFCCFVEFEPTTEQRESVEKEYNKVLPKTPLKSIN